MRTRRYVALLRGINVGGRNSVAMADLREAFEADGYTAVSTYIQSGNVLCESDAPRASSEGDLEAMLERRIGYRSLWCCHRSFNCATSSIGLRTGSAGSRARITRM